MKKYIITFLLLTALLNLNSALCKKYTRKDMAGQYVLDAPTLFDGTVVVAKDRSLSKLNILDAEQHPIAGRLKFKKNKQEMICQWPDSLFTGQILSDNIVTGVYDFISTNYKLESVSANMVRIPMLNKIIFHTEITRTKKSQMRGVVFFNYRKEVDRKEYRVVVYPRTAGTAIKQGDSRLKKLGWFSSNLPKGYETVECYLVKADIVDTLPDSTTDDPALTIDGVNIFSYDKRPAEWKIPKTY